MKRFIILILTIGIYTIAKAQSDSTHIVELQEITILSQKRIEKSTHTIIYPTSAEKTHSSNAFELVHAINLSSLEISYDSKQILNNLGQEVVLCLNGIEVSADEIAALRSKNVSSIEFQRNPTGKYLGKGGVLNFKTIQYDYGGNVYLSAKETFIYNSGEYLASTDYSWKKSRLALIYSNDWGVVGNKQSINNKYYFANGDVLEKQSEVAPIKNKNLSNALNLRFSNSGEKYRLSVLGAFADTRVPYSEQFQQTTYYGTIQNMTTSHNTSDSYGNAYSLQANYTRWLPKEQVVDLTVSSSLGRNNYSYHYQETQQEEIHSHVKEDNLHFTSIFQYFKTFANGINFSTVLDHYYTKFNDCYGGSVSEEQTLVNNISSAKLQLSKYNEKYYFYLTAGVSNMNTRLNKLYYNYFNPIGYYGITYTPKNDVSLIFNGYYVHTIFDPSYKNKVSIPTSFFEVTQGNPELKPIKAFSNTLEFNYNRNNTSLNASYMNYIYFDNIVHTYEADDSHIYMTLSNDGNFYGNMFTVTLAHSFFNDKLKISLKGIEEYNVIKGRVYNIRKNVVRGKFKIDYFVNRLRFGAELSTPYKALDIRAPFIVENRMDMTFYAMLNWKNWKLEASINNPISKYYISKYEMNYPNFDMRTKNFDQKKGRSITVKAVFNFSYGKENEKENCSVKNFLNNAILKSY